MKRVALIAAVLAIAFTACKKDKDEPVPSTLPGATAGPASARDYAQLSVGNYWIYEEFNVDSLGNGSPNGRYDSCYVERDTIIGANTYYKLVRPTLTFPAISYLRDSADYIVNQLGTISFSASDLSSHFNAFTLVQPAPSNDTVYESYGMMYHEPNASYVPAGAFQTLNYRTTYKMHGSFAAYYGTYRYINARYCRNIGLVMQTLPFFISSHSYTELRLVRYHVN